MEQTAGRPGSRTWEFALPAYRWGDLALFTLLWLSVVANALVAWDDFSESRLLAGFHHLVVGIAIAINAMLFIIRGPAKAREGELVPKLVAIVGSWMSLPLVWLPLTWQPGWLLVATTVTIMLVYVWVIWALLTLRGSFSVFPEARRLVREGPYGLVRHPLYAAYIIAYVAMFLPRLSPWALLFAATGIAGEILRSRYEEGLLRTVFPEYAEYAAATPRFMPRLATIWRRVRP